MIKTVLMKSWKLLRDSNKNISFFGPPPSIGGLVGQLVGQLVVWLVSSVGLLVGWYHFLKVQAVTQSEIVF